MLRDKLIMGFFFAVALFSLHLRKKVWYGKKLYTSCELSKVYRNSLTLTSSSFSLASIYRAR